LVGLLIATVVVVVVIIMKVVVVLLIIVVVGIVRVVEWHTKSIKRSKGEAKGGNVDLVSRVEF